ncbi:MAG: hypothetical protein ACI9K2_002707 [Myxococcota bacterium]|jgi:hypothetical protein
MLPFRPARGRTPVAVLAACAVVAVAHQAVHWDWFIEDAAISFAYARNLVAGEGLVPFPGGERIEAVSNPTWVALLAAFQLLGLDGFIVAKPLGVLLTLATLVGVWRLADAALPDHAGSGARIAPIALAFSAQHALWATSGLENALFAALVAALVLRTATEAVSGVARWSPWLALALVWTRPEGFAYAGVAGAWFAVGCAQAGHGVRPVARWAALVLGPSLLLEGARVAYFAWPLPNTFYAKVGERGIALLEWNHRGWGQLRGWAEQQWMVLWVPVLGVALTGLRGWRPRAALAIGVGVGLTLLWPGPAALRESGLWPALPAPPAAMLVVRCVLLLVAGAVLPLLARPSSDAPVSSLVRGLCGHLLWVGLAFAVAVDGDWMGGFRWMSLVIVPFVVLLAVGLTELLDRASPEWGPRTWVAGALAVGLVAPPNVSQTWAHRADNRDVTPHEVRLRVDYLGQVVQRTHHLGPVVPFDIDMGAFLWWAPEYRMVDMGGLVDVPMAHHWYQQRAFIEDYLRDERPPTFANVGVGNWWTKHTGMRRYDWFLEDYFVLRGYINGRGHRFPGIHARRDLVLAERGELAGPRRVVFEQQLVLEDLVVPTPWVAGQPGYLEAPFSTGRVRAVASGIQVVAVVSGHGRIASFDLPMGYGLYPMDGWRPDQVFRGRHTVRVPADWPAGLYDLSLVVRGPGGKLWAPVERPAEAVVGGQDGVRAVFERGEVRFPGVIRMVSPGELVESVAALRRELQALASADRCAEAEAHWERIARHRAERPRWIARERAEVAEAMSDCWARSAGNRPADAADRLARAHAWDHRGAALAEVGDGVAAQLIAEGDSAWARSDWEGAYAAYAAVLRFQPWRSWVRRWAEAARDERLGLTDDVRIGLGGEDDLRAAEAAGGG